MHLQIGAPQDEAETKIEGEYGHSLTGAGTPTNLILRSPPKAGVWKDGSSQGN
jgi:hypothetical protein